MDTFENIKSTWEKATKKISADKSLDAEFIKNAITADSIGISASLIKTIKTGVVLLTIDILLFIYNIYFYAANIPVLITIFTALLLSSILCLNLIVQVKKLKNIDLKDSNLREILVEKITYFNKSFYWVMQSIAIATALLPFGVNLTMENANGEFNISKIYLLIGFYLFVYFISISLNRIIHSIYLKQLKNALNNLEQKILDEMKGEISKNKKLGKIIVVCLILIIITGIVMFLIESVF